MRKAAKLLENLVYRSGYLRATIKEGVAALKLYAKDLEAIHTKARCGIEDIDNAYYEYALSPAGNKDVAPQEIFQSGTLDEKTRLYGIPPALQSLLEKRE